MVEPPADAASCGVRASGKVGDSLDRKNLSSRYRGDRRPWRRCLDAETLAHGEHVRLSGAH